MQIQARGYIASGTFSGIRVPQHLQNQIVKAYCDANNFTFVLSRAEYWINGSTQCQLWAALKEGFKHIVFFSLWQLPQDSNDRISVYHYCKEYGITLHFATERMSTDSTESSVKDLEVLIQTNQMIDRNNNNENLKLIQKLLPPGINAAHQHPLPATQ